MTKNRLFAAFVVIVDIFFIVMFVLFDLGFFLSLIADRVMNPDSSGGSYQYSRIRHAECALFHPDKQYQEIGGGYAWMSEVIGGYWCMSEEDLKKHRERA